MPVYEYLRIYLNLSLSLTALAEEDVLSLRPPPLTSPKKLPAEVFGRLTALVLVVDMGDSSVSQLDCFIILGDGEGTVIARTDGRPPLPPLSPPLEGLEAEKIPELLVPGYL